jgi:hypothetical protein
MKKSIAFFCWIFSIALLHGSCKKSTDTPSYESKISFTYNGQSYTRKAPSSLNTNIILVQGVPLFVNFYGLVIEDEANLLGGRVIITAPDPGILRCAFLQPTGSSVSAPGGNCSQLNNGGNPIDSVAVYWYESGSLNFSYSDCRDLTGTTIPGQKDCGVTGSFDLTLTNKNGQKIRLTNGSFSGRMKKYP